MHVECDLEPGDGDHVRPPFTGEQGTDGGVVHPGGGGDAAQRPFTNGLPEVAGEGLGVFGERVPNGPVRPLTVGEILATPSPTPFPERL